MLGLTLLGCLHLPQLAQSMLHPFQPLLGRPLPRCPLPSADPWVWVFPLLNQPFHPRLCCLQALFQPGFPTEGPAPGAGPDPHAVLSYLF